MDAGTGRYDARPPTGLNGRIVLAVGARSFSTYASPPGIMFARQGMRGTLECRDAVVPALVADVDVNLRGAHVDVAGELADDNNVMSHHRDGGRKGMVRGRSSE